jgi:hypothetical protein
VFQIGRFLGWFGASPKDRFCRFFFPLNC